jgi:hypothetical protein
MERNDDYYRRINSLKSFSQAEEYANELTEETGIKHLAYDLGPGCSPRFGAVDVPKIGDLVSKGFNGDYYPEGEVVSVSATFKKITTSTGVSFYRRGNGEGWRSDGTWWLVRGHVSEMNPSF